MDGVALPATELFFCCVEYNKHPHHSLQMSCTFGQAVRDFQRCCPDSKKYDIVCEVVHANERGKKWRMDAKHGEKDCADLMKDKNSAHELREWCANYGSEIQENGLTPDEACPGLCTVQMPPRYVKPFDAERERKSSLRPSDPPDKPRVVLGDSERTERTENRRLTAIRDVTRTGGETTVGDD